MAILNFSIGDMADNIKTMQDQKFDAIIVITGNRGLGKSTCALKIARRLDNFKLKRDIVFSRTDLMDHVAKKKRGVILADEMIAAMHNRDFWSEEQKKIIKMLNMYRDSFNVLIACIPNFADLDKQFRNLVKVRIDVIERGKALVHTQNPNNYTSDPWDMKVNEKIETNFWKKSVFKPRYNKLTTFRGMLTFGPLGSKIESTYVELKANKRNDVVQEDVANDKKKNPYERVYAKIKEGKIKREHLVHLAQAFDIQLVSLENNMKNRARADGTTLGQLLGPTTREKSQAINLKSKVKHIPNQIAY